LTAVKLNHLANYVNPTLDSYVYMVLKSCIKHSSLVAALKTVLATSAYLGLTNSAIAPPFLLSASIYSGREKSNVFVFPGNGERFAVSGVPIPI